MLKSIINYVKYHYQFCENIESSFLSNNLDTNECYIKSCLVYKYLFELYFRKNVTLYEIMTKMDITDFLFITNSTVIISIQMNVTSKVVWFINTFLNYISGRM